MGTVARIRALIAANDWTFAQAAVALGMTRWTLERLINGRSGSQVAMYDRVLARLEALEASGPPNATTSAGQKDTDVACLPQPILPRALT